jgi:hypothetical protein
MLPQCGLNWHSTVEPQLLVQRVPVAECTLSAEAEGHEELRDKVLLATTDSSPLSLGKTPKFMFTCATIVPLPRTKGKSSNQDTEEENSLLRWTRGSEEYRYSVPESMISIPVPWQKAQSTSGSKSATVPVPVLWRNIEKG